ncbi:MAG: protein translocase subunit SecD [Acetobacterales bacterium]
MVYFSRWKILLVVGVCLFGLLYAAPNVLGSRLFEGLPGWMPGKQINLGLDLQGGSHLLLEVETDVVLREEAESMLDAVRIELRRDRIRYTGLSATTDGVSVRIPDADQREQALSAVRGLARQLSGSTLPGGDPGLEAAMSEDGRLTLVITEAARRERVTSAVQQSVEIIRRRVDELGTREPNIQRQGEDRVIVQLPGIDDPERIKDLIGQTAKLTFHLVDNSVNVQDALQGRVPPGSEVLPVDERDRQGAGASHIVLRKRVVVSGDRLVDSQPTYDENNLPAVSFRFDSVGGRRFGQATSENVGRQLAIVLDGKVISAPVIRSAILGGNGIITGRFSVQEAQDLSLLLRAGALPAPLNILEERTVGPGLGADSIAAGKIACIVGLILVVVFMVAAYGLFGVLADIALFFNICLIFALLSLLQATLTLPGIAGIVLTIGMAVDANVLIFERIREEVRLGRTPISAIDAGYQRALTTIIDSNLTTLIAAVLLFYFGSGPIRGFAVTLSIGLLTSMFTAIMVTRLLVVFYLRRRRPQVLPI